MVCIVQYQAFSKAHGIGTGRGGMVEGTRIEVIGEEGWETEGDGGLVVLVDYQFSSVRSLAAAVD